MAPSLTRLATSHSQAKLERLLKDGNISFNLLWAIFTPESHVVITDSVSGEKQAFKLKSCSCELDLQISHLRAAR